MLGSQQFCVRWNSYQTNLQDVFPKLLNSEHFVDVTLACESQMIKCHKVVLSACSNYFEQLLVQNPCQHPIIFMKDMKHWEVQALVDFMYKGEVNVSQQELSTLLKAAEALEIRGLCDADRQQDSNAVSLPPETTLSDSGGRETPPAKRRKLPEQAPERREKQQPSVPTPKPANPTPSPLVTSTPSSTSNDLAAVLGVSGSITASVTSAPFRDNERNNTSKESHSEEGLERSNIKREHVDHDESYFDNDGDYDGSFEMQDDSNSMNPDISMPTSPLDQAGPSGISGMQGADKSTAGIPQVRGNHQQQHLQHQQHMQQQMQHRQHMQMQHQMHQQLENVVSTPTFSAVDYEHDQMNMNLHGMGASPGKARIRRSEDELRQAAECVVKGSTFQTVSDRFGIPISTIRFYMARRGILPQRRRGRSSAASSMINPLAFHHMPPPLPQPQQPPQP